MLCGATLLRPPKPISHDAVQKAPDTAAVAKGRDEARLSQLRSALNAGPAVQRLERASASLAGDSSAPVQMLQNKKGDRIDIAKLPDDLLFELAVAAIEGKTVTGYTFEKGDTEELVNTYQRRDQSRRKRKSDTISTLDLETEDKSDKDYVPTRDELAINYLTTKGRWKAGLDKIRYDDKGEEKELKPWPERGLQGALGEYEAKQSMEKKGEAPLDLNLVSLNFKGLDHISSHPEFPLEQTKLHLSDSTANVDTYLRHVKKAPTYALKAVKELKRHKPTLEKLLKDKTYSGHKSLNQIVKSLGKLEGSGDDDIDGSEVHDLVSKSMKFSVPSDIYKKMKKTDQNRFIEMDRTVSEFQDIMDQMSEDFTPSKPWGSKPNSDDEEWDSNKT